MNTLEKDAIKLIDKLYRELYLSKEVIHHSNYNYLDKFNNIKSYLDKLDTIHYQTINFNRHIDYLKKCYYNKYVIKAENIKNSFFEHKLQIALEQGYGHLKLTSELKKKYQDEIIENQKNSLNIWIDYLFSKEMFIYSFWIKYWVFQGMLKLGSYNHEKECFNKRTIHTTDSFIELNKEALIKTIDLLIKVLNKEVIEDKELDALVNSGSFSKIYSYIIKTQEKEKSTDGIWKKYEKESDYIELINSLKGYNTKWCTKDKGVAIDQLRIGSIYIYYTLDKNKKYTVPRIAIRMANDEIVEIKGIGKNQNLESGMERVVEDKIIFFKDKQKYYKKVSDMKKLTNIYNKHKNKEELSKEELYFLYEIENKILGFGLKEDPRIKEIIKKRNIKEDISKALGRDKSEVALKEREINENTVYYRGSLKYTEKSKTKFLPKFVNGYLSLDDKNFEGFFHTHIVGESLFLNNIVETNKLILPRIVCGDIYLKKLQKAGTLILPSRVDGYVTLENLRSANVIILPSYLGESLFLNKLTEVNTLVIPKQVDGYLHIDYLKNPKGIVFEKEFTGFLSLNSLETAEGLLFPETFNGTLCLNGLTTTKGLVLPKNFNGNLSLNSLKDAKDLKLPENFKGNLYLSSAENFEIPNNLTYRIYLKGKYINTEKAKQYVLKNKAN